MAALSRQHVQTYACIEDARQHVQTYVILSVIIIKILYYISWIRNGCLFLNFSQHARRLPNKELYAGQLQTLNFLTLKVHYDHYDKYDQ